MSKEIQFAVDALGALKLEIMEAHAAAGKNFKVAKNESFKKYTEGYKAGLKSAAQITENKIKLYES